MESIGLKQDIDISLNSILIKNGYLDDNKDKASVIAEAFYEYFNRLEERDNTLSMDSLLEQIEQSPTKIEQQRMFDEHIDTFLCLVGEIIESPIELIGHSSQNRIVKKEDGAWISIEVASNTSSIEVFRFIYKEFAKDFLKDSPLSLQKIS